LTEKNTLAYFVLPSLTRKNKLFTKALGPNVVKLFFFSTSSVAKEARAFVPSYFSGKSNI
jgi:hypothetical protein